MFELPKTRDMNSRGTWRTKFVPTRRMRAFAANEWYNSVGIEDVIECKAKATLEFFLQTNRKRDLDGLISLCKPLLDGAADASILKDDNSIVELTARKVTGTGKPSRVLITLETFE